MGNLDDSNPPERKPPELSDSGANPEESDNSRKNSVDYSTLLFLAKKALERWNISGLVPFYWEDGNRRYLSKWGHWQHQPQTMAELESLYWKKATGVGGVLSHDSKLVVLDLDQIPTIVVLTMVEYLGLDLDYNWIVRSGSRKGMHIWLCCPDLPTTAKKQSRRGLTTLRDDSAIELFVNGGIITLPPSNYIKKGKISSYQWLNEEPSEPPIEVPWDKIQKLYDEYTITPKDEKPSKKKTTKICYKAGSKLEYYQRWVNEEVLPTLDRVSPLISGKKHRTCPNPSHPDKNPSFRIGDMGAPLCTCNPENWDEVASWLGCLSYEDWKAKQRLDESKAQPKKTQKSKADTQETQQPTPEAESTATPVVAKDKADASSSAKASSSAVDSPAQAPRPDEAESPEPTSGSDSGSGNSGSNSTPPPDEPNNNEIGNNGSEEPPLYGSTDDILGYDLLQTWDGNIAYIYKKWYRYSDGVWKEQDTLQIRAMVWDVCIKYKMNDVKPTKYKVSSIMDYAKSRVLVPAEKADKVSGLINLKNGVYDVKQDKLLPHRRDYYFTSQLPFDYDPNATCPNWEEYLQKVILTADGKTDKEVITMLQEAFGYSLTDSNKHHKSFWLIGKTRSGKSTILKVLRKLAGSTATHLSLSRLSANPRFEIAKIVGKRIVTAAESASNSILQDDVFKEIVGGDVQTAEVKYKGNFDFVPICKLWWAMNETPQIRDKSGATHKRIIPFIFHRTVPDKEIITAIEEKLFYPEIEGIFNWALDGLRRLIENGEFTLSRQAEQFVKGMRLEGDVEATFLYESGEVMLDPSLKIKARELYNIYRTWAIGGGYQLKTETAIGREWTRLGLKKKRKSSGNYYIGIGKPIITDDDDVEDFEPDSVPNASSQSNPPEKPDSTPPTYDDGDIPFFT